MFEKHRRPTKGRLSAVFLALAAVLFGAFPASTPAAPSIEYTAPRAVAFRDISTDPREDEATEILRSDFDEDGLLDVLVASSRYVGDGNTTIRLHLLRGDAIALFDPPETIEFGTRHGAAVDAVRGDFDRDGHSDVVILLDHGVTTFKGDGAGGLVRILEFGLADAATEAIAADFDGDGIADLLVTGDAFGVALYKGDGTGDFLFFESFFVQDPGAVAAADFDEDGNLDLLLTQPRRGDRVSLRLGDGTGRFSDPVHEATEVYDPTDAVIGDFDGDGHADYVSVGSVAIAGRMLSLHRGDGTGAFATMPLVPARQAMRLGTGDFDGDGLADVLAQGHSWTIAFGSRGGALERPRTAPGPDSPDKGAAGDFDRDGRVDFVSLLPESNRFVFQRGDGRGGLNEPLFAPPPSTPRLLSDLVLADFDRDGALDAAATDGGTSSPRPAFLYRGDGAGGFSESGRLETPFEARIASGDFDGDGTADLAFAYFLEVRVDLGDGAGGFTTGAATPLPGSGAMTKLSALDADGDGRLDLALLRINADRFGNGSLTLLLGDGTGGFSALAPVDVGLSPVHVAAGDFDSDGFADFVVMKSRASTGFVLRGVAGAPPVVTLDLSEFGSGCPAIADFDGDGNRDIVLANSLRPATLRGDGAFSFAPLESGMPFGTCGTIYGPSIFPADADRDGDLDLLLSASSAPGASVLEQDGTGRFVSAFEFDLRVSVRGAAAGDVNGDGLPDLVVSSSEAPLVTALDATFDPIRHRRGAVNAALGPIADVVLVNGSAGAGEERRVTLGPSAPFELRVETPPSLAARRARFALYQWVGDRPTAATVNDLPFGLGVACLATPLAPNAGPQPRHVWNNTSRPDLLGAPSFPSSPAPSVVVSRPAGVGRPVTVFYQGIITDTGAPNGRAAVTNAIELVVR